MASKVILLTVASLIVNFDWFIPDNLNPNEINMEEKILTGLHKKEPLHSRRDLPRDNPLVSVEVLREIYDSRLKNNTLVAELILHGNWIWLDEWNTKFPFLSQLGVPMLDERKDETVWVTRMGKETKFRIKTVWHDMCSRDPNVVWHYVIWFNKCIPRHTCFCALDGSSEKAKYSR
nr:hypothetical protein [Tanacetum cinerariifolium]